MEIPHIIFNNGKLETKKDSSTNTTPKTEQPIPEYCNLKNDSTVVLEDKIRKWAIIILVGIFCIYGGFRLIKIFFGG